MSEQFDLPSYQARFEEAAKARGFSSENLVTTGAGEIIAYEKQGSGPVIYLSSGIHGDEPAPPLSLLALLEDGFFTDDAHWLICPILNPEGLATGSRENDQGIDLNRDYLQKNSDEVSAHVKWLQSKPCTDIFISLHEDWESEGFYFYEINLNDKHPQRKDTILSAVSPFFMPEDGVDIDGHEPREPGWIYHADEADISDEWPEAIYMAKNGCGVSYTFETPSSAELENRVLAHCEGVMALIDDFLLSQR